MTWWGDYIGTPFERAHCWALVRRVYAEQLGKTLPEYGEISADDLIRVARAMMRGTDVWVQVDEPAPFDVVRMRGKRWPVHVGVITRPGWLLHTEEATGAVHVPLDHWTVAPRVLDFWRHPA